MRTDKKGIVKRLVILAVLGVVLFVLFNLVRRSKKDPEDSTLF